MIADFLLAREMGEVHTAGTVEKATRLVRQTGSFDLIVLDYDMPGMSGLEGLQRMRKVNNERPVAIMSGTATPEIADAALRTGAAGFIPKILSSSSRVPREVDETARTGR